MNIPIGEDYITAVLQQLVQIDSTNPDLHPDNAGEGQIASFLASRCADLGLEVDLYEVADGRMNVVG
ncbi:MAG: M20 family peptidase, partial [Candidatus Promineifilaceae bacterium]